MRKIIVADGPSFGDFQFRLSALPVSCGGLGIYRPSDIIQFAYPASVLSSLRLQQEVLGLATQEVSPIVTHMVQSFAGQVRDSAPEITELTNTILARGTQPLENVPLPLHNLQFYLARLFFEATRSRLLSHQYITSKDEATSRRFRAILDSNMFPGASAWLFALPNGGLGQRMSPLEFQSAASLRLLIPQFEVDAKCRQHKCTATMDIYGYHALVCRGHLTLRHNTVRDALYDLLLKARFSPEKDAPVYCFGYRSGGRSAIYRPADILMAGDDFDRDCVDITVVSPLVTSNQSRVVVGKAAEEAESRKVTKHRVPCEQAGFGFKPFAVDVFGVMSKSAYKFLQRVCSKLVREVGYSQHLAWSICVRKISFSVQLGVAQQLIACRGVRDGLPFMHEGMEPSFGDM
jgi:hypothetical protein